MQGADGGGGKGALQENLGLTILVASGIKEYSVSPVVGNSVVVCHLSLQTHQNLETICCH
jgi:hypothetical protein